MTRITYHGSREDIGVATRSLAGMIAGTASDSVGVARGFLLSIGFAALSDIKEAFIVKANGGTDEMGISWPPLAPSTLASRNRRNVSSTEKRKQRKAVFADMRREEKRITGNLMARGFSASDARRRARNRVSVASEKALSQAGGQVEILRDTGVLLNSLSPGMLGGTGHNLTYSPPSDQILEANAGKIIVGTNVPYAGYHQNGTSRMPRRQIFPDGDNQIPQVWWDRWLNVARGSLQSAMTQLLQKGAA